MPRSPSETYAYIDAANLHNGTTALGWMVDFRKFRGWLRQKYGVVRAYIFVGHMTVHKALYAKMRSAGFILIFREVVYDRSGQPKGNCDTDLVLRALIDHFESNRPNVILVSSDGDYAPLVTFFLERWVSVTVLSPHEFMRCSILLKKTNATILFLSEVRDKIACEKP